MLANLLLSLYGGVTAFLPPWCSTLLCRLITRVVLLTSLKSRVERGMRRLLCTGEYDVEELTRRHIQFLVDMLHELLYIRYYPWPRHRLVNKVRCENENFLEEALKSKRGVILLSIHIGNFFWSMAHLSTAYSINLVAREEKNPLFQNFSRKLKEKWKIKSIYNTAGAAFKIRNTLKKGEIVIFVLDQYIFPFFYGANHPLRESFPRLVQMSGAPVIPFYTLEDNSHVVVRFLPPLKEVSPAVLEHVMMEVVKQWPHLWFWWRRLGKVQKEPLFHQ